MVLLLREGKEGRKGEGLSSPEINFWRRHCYRVYSKQSPLDVANGDGVLQVWQFYCGGRIVVNIDHIAKFDSSKSKGMSALIGVLLQKSGSGSDSVPWTWYSIDQ